MFRLTGSFSKFQLAGSRWTKALNATLVDVVREAMLEFLEAVITKVPVFTGMARGSLKPIGRFVGMEIPITPDPRAGEYPDKTPEAGDAASSFEFINDGKKVTVKFKEGVLHYLINEFYEVDFPFRPGNEGPWDSMKAGREAYSKYLKENLKKRIPKLKKYLFRWELKIDAEGNQSLRGLGFDV